MNRNLVVEEVRALDSGMLQELSGLLIRVVEDGASIGFLPPLEPEEASAYWRNVPGPGVHLWAARMEGLLIGTVQLHLAMKANGSHRAEVAKLMVHPEYRRNGAARLLMQTAEFAARRLGRTLLVLDTRSGDPSNHLYRSMDYVEAGRIPDFARSADGRLDETTIYYKKI